MHFLYKTHGCMHVRSLTHTDTHSEIGRPVLQAETESWEMKSLAEAYSAGKYQNWDFLSQVFWTQDQGITTSWLPPGNLEILSKKKGKMIWGRQDKGGVIPEPAFISSPKLGMLISSQLLPSHGLYQSWWEPLYYSDIGKYYKWRFFPTKSQLLSTSLNRP